jgi:hypothetical protein
MEYTFNVNTDGLNLDNYEKYLSKFSNWKENKREINLNTLLESNKKIEFEIEMDNSQSVNFVGIVDSESEVQFLEKGQPGSYHREPGRPGLRSEASRLEPYLG